MRSINPPAPLLQAHVFDAMKNVKYLLKNHTYPYFSSAFTESHQSQLELLRHHRKSARNVIQGRAGAHKLKNVRHFILIGLLTCLLSGCNPSDQTQQQKRELQRDVLKLRMGQALNPTDAEGYIQLGKAYRELGEYDKAIDAFQNAIALDDEHHHAYNNLGLVYTDLRLFALAIDMFLAALELSPGNPAFYNNLGYAYDMTDRFEEALDAFQNAIETEPTFVDAYYNMANAYLHREMYQDAIQNYEAALEIEEGDADTYFNLGLAYEENEDFLRAIQSYETGLSLDDSDAEAYYRLAQAYQKNGDPLMMRRYLEIFLKRAERLPHLKEEVRTAEQMLDR